MQTAGGKTVFKNRNDRTFNRQVRANQRQEIRAIRTNEEQIALIIARGGDPLCKEIERLSDRSFGVGHSSLCALTQYGGISCTCVD